MTLFTPSRVQLGFGYVPTPFPSGSEFEESLYHDPLSGMSPWESDIIVGTIFEDLLVNKISTSHMENEDEDEEMIRLDTDH